MLLRLLLVFRVAFGWVFVNDLGVCCWEGKRLWISVERV